jgi:hypothetical protein
MRRPRKRLSTSQWSLSITDGRSVAAHFLVMIRENSAARHAWNRLLRLEAVRLESRQSRLETFVLSSTCARDSSLDLLPHCLLLLRESILPPSFTCLTPRSCVPFNLSRRWRGRKWFRFGISSGRFSAVEESVRGAGSARSECSGNRVICCMIWRGGEMLELD